MKTNIGIIGVGRWGTNYLRTFNKLENAEISWICSAREESIAKALNNANVSNIKTTTNYKDILDDGDVDAVAIATPGSTHYRLAKESLKADKHVLVEKPLAFNSKDVKELIKAANKKKKILMVGHIHRFNSAIQKLKEDIGAGIFRNINYIHSFGSGNGPIRRDMNALWDFFPHDITILLHLLGEMPLTVSATGASYLTSGIEDVVTMDLKFKKNIFATAMASWLYPLKKRDLVVVGEKLYAVFDDYAAIDRLKYYNSRPKIVDGKIVMEDGGHIIPKFSDAKPLTEELKHFLYCIENNKKPFTDGHHALKVTNVLEAAQKSLEKNGAIVKVKRQN